MDYRELAEEFCQMRIKNAKTAARIEDTVTIKGETNVLLFLAGAKEAILAGKIAKELNLSASRGTNILNSLEKKGLIERSSDKEDRRKVYISLTDEGKLLIAHKHDEMVGRLEKVFRSLGEEDSKEYIRIMKKLLRIMDGAEIFVP